MKVADAHCDTLTEFKYNPLHSENAHWSIDKFRDVGGILQYFAIYTPHDLCGDSAFRFAGNAIGNFFRKMENGIVHLKSASDFDEDQINIVLSLEGGSPIIDDISNLYAFHQLGVRAMTLTWNHRNFIADGVDNSYGLTVFGKEVINEMEKLNWIIDVSHLNTAGFDDVCALTSKPFIASHSNSFTIHNHRRNLHDEQIKEIIRRNGFIGINFYSEFIGDKNTDLKRMFLKHIEYILELGGKNVLGMGSDFDGITESPFPDVTSFQIIANMLSEELNLNDEMIDKILYSNLKDYTLSALKID